MIYFSPWRPWDSQLTVLPAIHLIVKQAWAGPKMRYVRTCPDRCALCFELKKKKFYGFGFSVGLFLLLLFIEYLFYSILFPFFLLTTLDEGHRRGALLVLVHMDLILKRESLFNFLDTWTKGCTLNRNSSLQFLQYSMVMPQMNHNRQEIENILSVGIIVLKKDKMVFIFHINLIWCPSNQFSS